MLLLRVVYWYRCEAAMKLWASVLAWMPLRFEAPTAFERCIGSRQCAVAATDRRHSTLSSFPVIGGATLRVCGRYGVQFCDTSRRPVVPILTRPLRRGIASYRIAAAAFWYLLVCAHGLLKAPDASIGDPGGGGGGGSGGTSTLGTSSTEISALTNLYYAAGGSAWTYRTNWLSGDPCLNSWYGVSCDTSSGTALVT